MNQMVENAWEKGTRVTGGGQRDGQGSAEKSLDATLETGWHRLDHDFSGCLKEHEPLSGFSL